MKMEHYLSHTDFLIWQVIQNGNSHVSITTDTNGIIKVLPLKTAEEVVAREKERKARTTLLMALPKDHLAKSIRWLMQKRCGKLSNQDLKFLRSLPSSWSQVALIMRTKPGLDTLSFDDLYNNIRVFEHDVKGTTASSSNTQNVAFVSAENTSSTNDQKRDAGYNGNKTKDNGRRPTYQDDSKALVPINRDDIDWSGHVEEDAQNYAMMAYSSSNSGSDNEVKSCSKEFKESYARLKTLYDDQRDKLGDASVEITAYTLALKKDDPHKALKDKGIVGSGCFKHMTGNKAHLVDYQEFKGGSIAFGGSNGRITGKGKINTGRLDFEDVYYVEELKHYNLFYVSQMYDKKNKVLFTDTDCLVLSPDFKLPDENQREYSNARTSQQNRVSERKNRTFIKATRTMLADLFLPTTFLAEAVNTACYVLNRVSLTKPQNKTPYELLTGKQPIISYLRPFGCYVTILNIIDQLGKFYGKSNSGFLIGYSLNSKAFRVYNSETKRVEENLYVNFIENKPNVAGKGHAWMFDLDYLTNSMNYEPISVENQANKSAGPKEANNSAGTQANDDQGANSEETNLNEEHFVLPIWSTYSTIVKSSGDKIEKNTGFKTCEKPVSQVEQVFLEELNKLKRQEKEANDAAESLRKEATHDIQNSSTSSTNLINTASTPLRFLIGYSLNSKAFRVYNLETKRVEENLHVNFIENKPNVVVKGHAWIFDLDYLTKSMNYEPVLVENQANKSAGLKEANNSAGDKIEKNTGFKTCEKPVSQVEQVFLPSKYALPDDPLMPHLEDIYASPSEEIFTDSSYDDKGVVTDFNNLETTVSVSLIPTIRIHTIHPKTQILGDTKSAVQTRSKVNKNSEAYAFVSYIQKQQKTNHKDFQHCLFACFLSQIEPKNISQALDDESWVDAMQEELLQFQIQKGHRKEEGIDYDEIFALVARIEAIRIFLAFASYIGFIVYQIDVKSAFLYGIIDGEVYMLQPPGFVDLKFPNKIYKVVKAIYGLHQAPRAWFQMSFMGELTFFLGLQVKQKEDGIFISQYKYVAKILKKIDFLSVKTANTPIETQKPLVKDEEAADVDVHLYRFQVTPKTSHLHAVKRIFRRLISLQCKKQTIVATSSTETTAKVKTINDEVRIQALIDQNRVNIKESSIRRTLKLDDADGTSCLANAEIFNGLAKMGYEILSEKLTFYKSFFSPQWKFLIHTILQCLGAKTTSWNEFSRTMASAIICLATNQKFNFSSYILLSLVKNIETVIPFFRFPRFVQFLIDHQMGDMSHHKDIYDNPSLTKKVFANIKRVGTGFSRVVTPLFDNMLVPAAKEIGLIQDDVQPISIPTKPSTSKPHKKHKPKKQQTQAPKVPYLEPSPEHKLPSPSNDPLPGGKDSLKLKALMDLCTHLYNKVLELESNVIDIKSTYKERIEKLEGRVGRLEEENRVLKGLYSVHSKVDTAAPVVKKEKSFKQEKIIANINEEVEINLEEAQAKLYRIDLEHPKKVLSMHDVDDEEPAEVEEVLEVVTAAKLITEVVTTVGATTTAEATKVCVQRKRRGVVIQDPKETTSTVVVHSEVQSKDKGKGILIEEPNSLKGQAQIEKDEAFARQLEAELDVEINWNTIIEQVNISERLNDTVIKYQALKRKPLTKAQVRKNIIIYLKNIAGYKMNYFKGMTYSEIRPLFEKHYNYNQAFLEEVNEKVTVPEKEVEAEGHKREGGSLKKDITKKQKMDEEAEELKSHLQIVSTDDDDDDVYTEATPLASKIPIVDYKINLERNKPYFKIIRADDQKGRYGLAKRYPLTPFTLEQMLNNVRLEVEDVSEMSLELLRLRKIHSKGLTMTKDKTGNEIEFPHVTAQQILARTRDRKAKSTLLMAILDEHLARFHRIKDAKTLWAAIKTIFGGNAKSKKMQQNVLKQQFEIFSVSNSEGLDKGNISLIVRNKPGIDNLDIDDLYNNIKVYKADIKGSSGSYSNSHNAIVLRHKVPHHMLINSCSHFLLINSSPQLDKEYLVQVDQDDLEEVDVKWQVAMLSMRVKRFYKKTRKKREFHGKELVRFDKNKVECFRCHRRGHFARDCRSARNSGNRSKDTGNARYRGRDNGKRPAKEEDEQALVVQDGLGYDSQLNEKEVLDIKEKEVTKTVFDNRSSDEENSVANDRFKKGEGYHAVPPSLTGNYMPPKLNLLFAGLDNSVYKFKISETVTNLDKDEKDAPETSTACVEKPKEDRPVWNNVQRINHQNKFAPTAVFTRSGRIPVSATKPKGHPQQALKNKGIIENGCSRHMTGNKACLADYQEIHDGVTDDFSRFSWVFFLATKDETKFKNRDLDEFCGMTGIKREYKNARTPQQNRVAERKNMTLIEAGRIMLVDSLLPVTFWTEAVNTACYVLNRALVTKTHNKTPYELLNGKFKGKADEGFLVGYCVTSKAFRVFNTKTRKVKENVYVSFLKNKPNVAGTGPNWLFDIDSLTNSINYIPVSAGNQTDKNAGLQDTNDDKPADDKPKDDTGSMTVKELADGPSSPHPDAFIPTNTLLHVDQDDSQIPNLEETAKLQSTGIFNSAYDDDLDIYTSLVQSVGAEADFNNMEFSTIISHIPTHKMEPKKVSQALDDESWVEAMQEELLQFSLQKVWRLVDLPYRKKAIRTKWVYRNKKDERGIVVRNKARLVVQGHRQEEGIDYDEEVYVSQPPGFIDPQVPNKVYKVEKALYGLHQAAKAWYLKGRPKLGLWYPRNSPFDLEAYSDSDYAGANLDRKSTTGGCQFLSRRLISWQCKKQTIVATSTTKAEYVAATHCCGHVLWIQNQMLDYGFNFMNTKIYIDNESIICIVKNLV
nr:putative ribonuclease H-like domain-containing protein [Tanacetum cinerariifolium]